ncbi:MAG: hypothetical protein HYX69_12215 [Planctomycetia bacterium]|nr:hypothetical protein [Planctomycetia bacterium]
MTNLAKASFAWLASFAIVAAWCAAARADGGLLRASDRLGPWRVSIFTSPTPLVAGAVDVSVLVQDAETDAVVPDATVTVEAHSDSSGAIVRVPATSAAATNKLFQAARCDLPAAGTWRFSVEVAQGGNVRCLGFDADVAEPLLPSGELALWIGWPVVPIALFLVHHRLVRLSRVAIDSLPAKNRLSGG